MKPTHRAALDAYFYRVSASAIWECIQSFQRHLEAVESNHRKDPEEGYGRVDLPDALARKCANAIREWRWQYVFPQENRRRNPRADEQCRHYVDESLVQRAVALAAREKDLPTE